MGKILDFPNPGGTAAAEMIGPLEDLQKEILGDKVLAYATAVITKEGPRIFYIVHPEGEVEDAMLLLAATDLLRRDLNDAVHAAIDPDSPSS